MRMVGLMQAFPQRSKRRLERERATVDIEGSHAELAAASLDIARETARAWIRRAALESAIAGLRRLRHDVAFGAEAARAGVAAGRASTAEALAAQAAVVRLDNRILELETGAHHAQVELGRWIGTDAERPSAPAPDVDRLPEPAAALLAGIERHGPVLPYAARLEAARVDVAMARADKRPDWSAALRFGKRGPDFSDMATLEFSIGLPLFARQGARRTAAHEPGRVGAGRYAPAAL
jgi:outer membrane protein TolC